ncbi:unnamed protein product [Jaminaea pallidilutea]
MVHITLFALHALFVFLVGSSLVTADLTVLNRRRSLHASAFRDLFSDTSLKKSDVQSAPQSAVKTTYNLTSGSLIAWQNQQPAQAGNTESVVIITHGVDRNAKSYFNILNSAYNQAHSSGLSRAPDNTLRIAPLFYDAKADKAAIQTGGLAWGANNAWCIAEGSVRPKNRTSISSLTVYDELVQMYSNRTAFPNVKTITFVGHGCGAMLTQRYAALGKDLVNNVSIRYVVGNPSSMLYFTSDRPSSTFKPSSCPAYNNFFYGLEDYYIPYDRRTTSNSDLFKSYAKRDVRYLVSLNDNGGGDQTCEARAAGGKARKDRTLAYWKYIHLLAGESASSYQDFKGTFPNITSDGNDAFHGASISHQLSQLSGVGHDASSVINSKQGRQAIFG